MPSATLTPEQAAETATAISLHQALARLNLAEVPVMTLDRGLPRMQQACLAQELFLNLGLQGISVSVPSYRGAQDVN